MQPASAQSNDDRQPQTNIYVSIPYIKGASKEQQKFSSLSECMSLIHLKTPLDPNLYKLMTPGRKKKKKIVIYKIKSSDCDHFYKGENRETGRELGKRIIGH